MRALASLVLSVALAGCVAVPSRVPVAGAPVDPARVVDWTASGRLAIAVAGQGGNGSFEWVQRAERTELQVRGPLGAGGVKVVTDGSMLSIVDGEGRGIDADAARATLRERLGLDLPLAELRYWMLGLAAPGSPADVSSTADGSSRVIAQSGWTVTYAPFSTQAGWSVPTRMTAAGSEARIKLIVDGWRLPERDAAPVDQGTP